MARVLVPIAPGCEELEAVTIIDLLRRANIGVVSAGLNAGSVTCSRGTVLIPDTVLDDVLSEDFDMIVLPGGLPGADHLQKDVRIQHLLKLMVEKNRYVAAICAAPKALASAGVLDGKAATSFPGALVATDKIQLKQEPVVVDGKIITSRGPGTAMDFALSLIEALCGEHAREQVEQSLLRP